MKTLRIVTTASCSRASDATRITTTSTSGLTSLATRFAVVLAAFIVASSMQAFASDPIGIYGILTKVVLEPNDENPERVQVWGCFAQAEGRGYSYKSPQKGFFYYKLPAGKEKEARNEWSDLKSAAGTGKVVGFASRHGEKGTLRKSSDKPANPDAYPVAFGVTTVRRAEYEPVESLKSFYKREHGKDGDKKEPGKTDSKRQTDTGRTFRAGRYVLDSGNKVAAHDDGSELKASFDLKLEPMILSTGLDATDSIRGGRGQL